MKANTSYKAIVAAAVKNNVSHVEACETANVLFGITTLCGEGYEYTRGLLDNLPFDFSKWYESGMRIIETESVPYKRFQDCCSCKHSLHEDKPKFKKFKYNYIDKNGNGCTSTIMVQIATYFRFFCDNIAENHDKDFQCIQDVNAVLAVPTERHRDNNRDKALIVSRRVKCCIADAMQIISILSVLELDYKAESALIDSAKRHNRDGKLLYWINQYTKLAESLKAVTFEEQPHQEYIDDNPFGSIHDESEENEFEGIEIDADNNQVNDYDYYRFNGIDKIPTSGIYASVKTKADLYAKAKSEGVKDYKSFKKHEATLIEIQDSDQDFMKAKAFIEKNKSNKVLMAKSKRRLIDYTYNGLEKPSWLTPDRLNALWKAIK